MHLMMTASVAVADRKLGHWATMPPSTGRLPCSNSVAKTNSKADRDNTTNPELWCTFTA
jgi:hypothetical protein